MSRQTMTPGKTRISIIRTGMKYAQISVDRPNGRERGRSLPSEPEIAHTLERLGYATFARIQAEYRSRNGGPRGTHLNKTADWWIVDCPRSDVERMKVILADLDRLDPSSAEEYITETIEMFPDKAERIEHMKYEREEWR